MRSGRFARPDDVSVIGFDDLDFAALMNPSLPSAYQPGYQLGVNAARILLDHVKGEDRPPQHIVLETELKLRESVAPPAGGSRKEGSAAASPLRPGSAADEERTPLA